ncbi:MAG: Lrp/AsnC ligand binding domain-containing protein [Thermonemataceae bacterium]
MSDKNYQIDNTDLKILDLLLKDATMPYTEVAERVFVSPGTIHVRMKKLRQLGIVKGSQILLDYQKLGWDVSAFIGIYLNQSSIYDTIVAQLNEIPEIVSIHYTTGAYSIFLRILCRDTEHLREVLNDKIQRLEGIQRTETFISLEDQFRQPPIV